jgi:hypothetical protein
MKIIRVMRCLGLILTLFTLSGVLSEGEKPSGDFSKAENLCEAVEMAKSRLTLESKPQYAALLSEDLVKEAISNAIKGYEVILEKSGEKNPGSREHFQLEVKPILVKIEKEGAWTKNCSFTWFYGLKEKEITYPGFGLRLSVNTPGGIYSGFALPIIDLYYGRFFDGK